MPDYQIILLPKENYYDWVGAARDYVLKFGANLTPDPDSAGRYMTPQQVITIAGLPNGYPAQGDIQAWFKKNYPSLRVDYLPAKSLDEFKSKLQARIAANSRYGQASVWPVEATSSPEPPPTIQYPWLPGLCLSGVHGRSDGRMQEPDFAAVAQSRVEAVKLASSAAPEDVDRLRSINPNVFILVRLFASFKGRNYGAAEFAQDLSHDMGQFYQRGIRYFEVHNEVNLIDEGWTTSWQNGREFGQWFLEVRNRLKALYPEALFGYPGLSPDGVPMSGRTNDVRFLEESDEAVRAADWIGVHCYWRDEAEMNAPAGGLGWQEYRRRYPDKLLFVTEFSNPYSDVDRRTKAQQYVKYYQLVRHAPGVGAVFSFVLSSSRGFEHEVWRDEAGNATEIPGIVGARAV